jgi:septum formation protein
LFLKSPNRLILASTSAYRKELLGRTKIPFECLAPGVDETARAGELALELVRRLARAKAYGVVLQHPAACVIGSDQVAVWRDPAPRERIFGKPGSVAACIDQLSSCSGRRIEFLTAVAVLRQADGFNYEFVDTTCVTFRHLEPDCIRRYVAAEQPLDCAGGFKSEGLGITLCESIVSEDPTALIGLPLIRLAAALRCAGFEVP